MAYNTGTDPTLVELISRYWVPAAFSKNVIDHTGPLEPFIDLDITMKYSDSGFTAINSLYRGVTGLELIINLHRGRETLDDSFFVDPFAQIKSVIIRKLAQDLAKMFPIGAIERKRIQLMFYILRQNVQTLYQNV